MQLSFVTTIHHNQMGDTPDVCSGYSRLTSWPRERLP